MPETARIRAFRCTETTFFQTVLNTVRQTTNGSSSYHIIVPGLCKDLKNPYFCRDSEEGEWGIALWGTGATRGAVQGERAAFAGELAGGGVGEGLTGG